MSEVDFYRMLISAYYGIEQLDEYELKCYILKDIEEYIHSFIKQNQMGTLAYKEEAEKIKDAGLLQRNLQDALLVLHQMDDAPMELILLIKQKLRQFSMDGNRK